MEKFIFFARKYNLKLFLRPLIQSILFNSRGEVRSGARCLEPDVEDLDAAIPPGANATFATCDGSDAQKWTLDGDEGRIVHRRSGMCLAFKVMYFFGAEYSR